jgi:hypothetical protein
MLALAMPALATALEAFNTGYDAPMLSHPKASLDQPVPMRPGNRFRLVAAHLARFDAAG